MFRRLTMFLMVCKDGRGMAGKSLVGGEQSSAVEVDGDGGAPVRGWQRKGAGELCEVTAKLARGLRGLGRA